MGALPKNKITKVERGKRRAGNKPTITKDSNRASVPLHKRSIIADLKKKMGLDDKQTARPTSSRPVTTKPAAGKATAATAATTATTGKPESKPAKKSTKAEVRKIETSGKVKPTKSVAPGIRKTASSKRSGTR